MREISSHSTSVAARARELLSQHAHFSGRANNFEFECHHNVLVIRGRVPTFYLKQLVQDALKQLEGVRQIDNRVDVMAPAGLSSIEPG